MVSFRAHGHRHWYQSLTATVAAGSLNPLGTVQDEHGEAAFACVENPCNSTAAQQDTAGMSTGVQLAPHPPWTPFLQHIRSLCTPTRSLSSMGRGRDTPCTVSCLCIQPSHQSSARWELQETLLSPSLGYQQHPAQGLSPTALCPLSSRAGGTSIPASVQELGQDPSAQGSQSSPITQPFQGISMSVTLSKCVYNPAAALGSQGCCSAGTRCCQHPDARVPCTLWYPWGCVHPHGEGAGAGAQRLFYA